MKTAAYLLLYRELRHQVTTGAYSYMQKLPGKREIAEKHSLSLVTVEHALQLLEDEGYVSAKERSGIYVIYQPDAIIPVEETPLLSAHESVSSHQDEMFPISAIARTIRKILSDHPDEIMEQTGGKGLVSLRMAICRYFYRSHGIQVDPQQVIIGSGSEYLYSIIVQLLGRDRIYGIEYPSYEKIARMYRANGVRIDPLKMGRTGILTNELERTPASVLHITPYHSYPTGVTADASKRQEYIKWAEEREAFIVEDDYDSEYTVSTKPEDTLFSLEPDHTVIYLNTFNRTISPGFRVSYMILPKKFIPLYEKEAGFYASTVSTLTQMVIAELIDSGDFERHINKVRRKRRKQRDIQE